MFHSQYRAQNIQPTQEPNITGQFHNRTILLEDDEDFGWRLTCSSRIISDLFSLLGFSCPFWMNWNAFTTCMSTSLPVQSPYSDCSQYEHRDAIVWAGQESFPVNRSCRICKHTWYLNIDRGSLEYQHISSCIFAIVGLIIFKNCRYSNEITSLPVPVS